MLEMRAVTKKYGKSRALDAVTLSLASGKTHAIIGSSGSGKSTLLRATLGLIPFEMGSIHLNGSSVSELSPPDRALKMGYVPQDAGLFPHLTSAQNITLVARALKWSNAQVTGRLRELNQFIQLDHAQLNRFPIELSGGQKQRVALMRSLFLDPNTILMDEPFGALDPLIRADLQLEIKSLFARLRKTVILVTHDVGEAQFIADNIVLMHEGRIIQEGHLKDLAEKPATPFVTKFLQAHRGYRGAAL